MQNELPLKKVNDEVYIASDEVVRLDARAVEFIRECALRNQRGRARICAHKDATDSLHEMLIGIRPGSYLRPHRHFNKAESFHLVSGDADIVVFTDDGEIDEIIGLRAGSNFYYRMDRPRFHTLLINSDVLVFHEITNGPFDSNKNDFAEFAPPEGEAGVEAYMTSLRQRATTWKARQAGDVAS